MRGRIFPSSYIKQPLTQLRTVDVTNNGTQGSFGRIQKRQVYKHHIREFFYLIIYFPCSAFQMGQGPSTSERILPSPSQTPLGGTVLSSLRDQGRAFTTASTAQGCSEGPGQTLHCSPRVLPAFATQSWVAQ